MTSGVPAPQTSTAPGSSTQPAADSPCTSVALAETIGAGFNAWELKKEPSWEAARLALPPLLACQPEPLSPALSVRVLAFQGLSAGGAKREAEMDMYFRGVAAMGEDAPFSEDMFPPDNYYRRHWATAADAPVSEPVILLDPEGAALDRRVHTFVNGERTREVHPGVYSVVQVAVRPRGVLLTVPLSPSAEDPRLPTVPALQDALAESDRANQKRRGFLIASGVAALAASGVELGARSSALAAGTTGGVGVPTLRLHATAGLLCGASVSLLSASWVVGR